MRVEYLLVLWFATLTGCAGPTFAPDQAPEYLVIKEHTPLYRLGPQQGSPPEDLLPKGEPVRMLRKEFGFSFVQIRDGQTGYVGNDSLVIASPRPAREQPSTRESSSGWTRQTLPVAVEPPLPDPDLDETPDAPAGSR